MRTVATGILAALLLAAPACTGDGAARRIGRPTLAWDESTLTLIEAGGLYGRMIRLRGGDILCVYEKAAKAWARRSRDNGRTWAAPALAAECPYATTANPEVLQLDNGWLLLMYNERPRDGVHPFAIRTAVSKDGGATWPPQALVYEAGTKAENGCWEPAAIQKPSGEIQLFFANESPYRTSAEQEISMVRSRDRGATWGKPATISFRRGKRDGMPVPLLLAGGRGIAVAIEDSGPTGHLRPAILFSSLADDWRHGPIRGDSPQRWRPVDLPDDVYAGAPYLAQLPTGETLLACQSAEGRREWQMAVYVGDASARQFGERTVPLKLPPGTRGSWNALFVKDARTVTAISSTTQRGVAGLWAIDARVVRP